jgi:hypothetical protein
VDAVFGHHDEVKLLMLLWEATRQEFSQMEWLSLLFWEEEQQQLVESSASATVASVTVPSSSSSVTATSSTSSEELPVPMLAWVAAVELEPEARSVLCLQPQVGQQVDFYSMIRLQSQVVAQSSKDLQQE